MISRNKNKENKEGNKKKNKIKLKNNITWKHT